MKVSVSFKIDHCYVSSIMPLVEAITKPDVEGDLTELIKALGALKCAVMYVDDYKRREAFNAIKYQLSTSEIQAYLQWFPELNW